MNFLAPAAFALTLLLPVVVAMYLLKLRRIEREVPSVFLWKRMVRDVEANAPWQRLRRNLLLLLQLLFLAALIFTLARPFTWTEGTGGQSLILILDSSASMGAVDIPPSRLEAAKNQARSLVDAAEEGTRLTVISAGVEAQVMVSSTQDRRQAHLAIERVQPGAGSSNLSIALELASALAARQPDTEIVVLSDGRVELPERMAIKGHLRYLPIGLSGDNQAIGQLSLEPSPSGSSLTAFAQVVNYHDAPVDTRLSLYADGLLVNVYDLSIPARGQRAVIAEDLDVETKLLEAQLNREDALPADNRAVAVPLVRESARVNLVSRGNLFLETAMVLLPGIDGLVFDPGEGEVWQPTEMTILDGYVPITATLPAGNLFFVAPVRSTDYFTVTGKIENPQLRVLDPEDPLVRHVALAEILVQDAVVISPPDWARVLVVGEAGGQRVPILMAGQVDGRRIVILAFDITHSDLPLQVAYPLLMANLVSWLTPGQGGVLPAQVSPGQAVSFSVAEDVTNVSVTRPDGRTVRLQPEQGRVTFSSTGDLGVYTLRWGQSSRASFAVNLFSPDESDLKPAAALPGLSLADSQDAAELQQARREWWRPLAMLSLAVLTGEWLVYQRSALARLRGEARKAFSRIKRPGK
jgi:Ca-activated chloride channel homolog